ncbi:MAG: hypothetical protein ABEI86_11540 [Halobacteriaceae archaeon]
MAESRSGDMTLVITLEALELLEDPQEALEDATDWTRHLGVGSERETDEIADELEAMNANPEFIAGNLSSVGSLSTIRQRFPAERYVYVSQMSEDEEMAEALGWEFVPFRDAARKAGWPIREDK